MTRKHGTHCRPTHGTGIKKARRWYTNCWKHSAYNIRNDANHELHRKMALSKLFMSQQNVFLVPYWLKVNIVWSVIIPGISCYPLTSPFWFRRKIIEHFDVAVTTFTADSRKLEREWLSRALFHSWSLLRNDIVCFWFWGYRCDIRTELQAPVIWAQIVCNGNQQKTKVTASKDWVEGSPIAQLVECQTCEQEVVCLNPTSSAVLCLARHFFLHA